MYVKRLKDYQVKIEIGFNCINNKIDISLSKINSKN